MLYVGKTRGSGFPLLPHCIQRKWTASVPPSSFPLRHDRHHCSDGKQANDKQAMHVDCSKSRSQSRDCSSGCTTHSPSHGSNHGHHMSCSCSCSSLSSRSASNYQMDSKNAHLCSNSVAGNAKDHANASCNIPWSELPRSQKVAYDSIFECFKSRKGHSKK